MRSPMKLKWISSHSGLAGLFILAFLLAACGGTPTPAPGEPTVAPTAASSGLCANDFFPVVDGATWTYASSGSAADVSWTSTITDVSDSNFTMTNQFDTLTATQQWSCTADGLAALQYGSGPEATLLATGVTGSFETTGTSGVTFPTHLSAGDTWSQSFNIHGDMNIAEGQTATADGMVTQNYTAVGSEDVSVPAGDFSAMKVETSINFDMQITVNGLTVPFNIKSTETNWWAPGTGWVKSVSTYSIEGSSSSSTTELQSFSIP